MWYSLLWERRRRTAYLGCVLLLLCVSTAVGDPKPLSKDEQARIDKAIDRAVAGLKHVQTKQGDWPRQYATEYLVGQCALPAYALLEAGVPADDPVIQKAADFIRSGVLVNEKTYELSLALLFFDRLGDPKDKPLIRSLALRLIAGQHVTGGWNYRCPTVGKKMEDALFKALVELNKGQEEGQKSMAKLLKDIRVPPAARAMTVFCDPRLLAWQDAPDSEENEKATLFAGTTDNSNTQFAMLGLWAAQRHDVPVGPTFRRMVERFELTQQSNGWWTYLLDRNPERNRHPRSSMICVGLLGLAIGRGQKYATSGVPERDKADLSVLKGLAALSQDIGVAASGQEGIVASNMRGGYYLWSVERVAMLYNLPTIGDKDWYRWGAGVLVTSQRPGGEWRSFSFSANSRPSSSPAPILNTAYALLFLKRSHPMKDLTPKLPFTAKELNQGIARLLAGENLPERTATTSSESKKPESPRKIRDP